MERRSSPLPSLSEDDWKTVQGVIYDRYMVQNLSLHQVGDHLRDTYGVNVSLRMIKDRLVKWKYTKNMRQEDWYYLAVLYYQRRLQNKHSVFKIHSRYRTVQAFQRFLRDNKTSLREFLNESYDRFQERGQHIPGHIRAHTPTIDEVSSSPAILFSSTLGGTAKLRTEVESESRLSPSTTNDFKYACTQEYDTIEPNQWIFDSHKRTTRAPSQPNSNYKSRSMQSYLSDETRLTLVAYSTQLLKPVELHSRVGHYDFRGWRIVDLHDITISPGSDEGEEDMDYLNFFEPKRGHRNLLNDDSDHEMNIPASAQEGGALVWMSLCFLAGVARNHGHYRIVEKILDNADQKFEDLLRKREELLPTAMALTMTMLHQHDQEAVAKKIAKRTQAVVDRVLPETDSIGTTILRLAVSIDANGPNSHDVDLHSRHWWAVHETLSNRHYWTHPCGIAALANYAWLLKAKGDMIEAATCAFIAYEHSKEWFGCLHLQTVICLSVYEQCLDDACLPRRIAACRQIAGGSAKILGIIHPYTLEALSNLTDNLYKSGAVSEALELDRSVLFGWVTLLGKQHKFAIGQRKCYEERLRGYERWESARGSPSREQVELEGLFGEDPEQVWMQVSRTIVDFCKIEPSDIEDIAMA